MSDLLTAFYCRISGRISAWASTDDGQGLTEYALILALIAIVAIVALHFLGGKVTNALSTVGSSLNT